MQIDIQIPFSEIKIIYKREGFELVAGFFSDYGPPLIQISVQRCHICDRIWPASGHCKYLTEAKLWISLIYNGNMMYDIS